MKYIVAIGLMIFLSCRKDIEPQTIDCSGPYYRSGTFVGTYSYFSAAYQASGAYIDTVVASTNDTLEYCAMNFSKILPSTCFLLPNGELINPNGYAAYNLNYYFVSDSLIYDIFFTDKSGFIYYSSKFYGKRID